VLKKAFGSVKKKPAHGGLKSVQETGGGDRLNYIHEIAALQQLFASGVSPLQKGESPLRGARGFQGGRVQGGREVSRLG
jgi:hypothetical protein